MPKSDARIRPLQRSDDRSGFCSVNIDLERYAGQNQFRHHVRRTYVAVTAERVCGFVIISPGELTAESIPRSVPAYLPAYPLPVLPFSRPAVDERDQCKENGRLLPNAMFGLASDLRDRFGCMGGSLTPSPAPADSTTASAS
jgi:hypothetical protein